MLTKWQYLLETEAERLIHTAHNMVNGFYKTNNFIVLPYQIKDLRAYLVTLPDLDYQSIPRFWEKVSKVNVMDFPLAIDPEITKSVVKLIEGKINTTPQYSETERLWLKAEKDVLDEIYKILPHKKDIIKKITIHPTNSGTGCSFNLIKKEGEVIMYLRQDCGIHTIAEAIITSLTRRDIYDKLEGLWQESEIITDFLITQTSLSKVLQKYEDPKEYLATIKGIRVKQQAKLLSDSQLFYKKLGIPTFEKPFGYNGLVPELFGNPLQNLTATERRVILNLIKNSNNVTSLDDIGTIMFNSDTQFSLYAIAKLIQRLRNKLEANGISGSYIQTLRGKGYLLKN